MSENSKTEERFGLLKVPDVAIIKEQGTKISALNVELGKCRSYIDELEAEVNILRAGNKEAWKEMRREVLIAQYKNQITHLNQLVFRLRKDQERLITLSLGSRHKAIDAFSRLIDSCCEGFITQTAMQANKDIYMETFIRLLDEKK